MNAAEQFIFFLKEFEKLKDEQHKRIEFRDQMIYLTLAAIGAVFSFALEKPALNIALLVLPFLCIIMGWTYLINDEKISAIANYIRNTLISKLESTETTEKALIGMHWELFVKHDITRRNRKYLQLIIDLATFIISAGVAITCFFILHHTILWYHIVLACGEVLALIGLAVLFIENSNA